jgi:hypothetical protein
VVAETDSHSVRTKADHSRDLGNQTGWNGLSGLGDNEGAGRGAMALTERELDAVVVVTDRDIPHLVLVPP